MAHTIPIVVKLKAGWPLLVCLVAFLPPPAQAQVVSSEVPYYSYGSGIGISSDDSLFLLNIRFRIQSRLAYASEGASDLSLSELQARIQRLRLRLDGFFYKPELIYIIQLGFSQQDMGAGAPDLPSVLKDAVIFYRFNRHISLGLGLTNLPRNRQSVISSGDLELVDRSLVNNTFAIERDFGLQAYYYNNLGRVYYALRAALTAGEGSNALNSNEGFSYTGRVELLPLGTFKNKGDYFEGDLEREEKPKASVGLTYNFNKNTTSTDGASGGSLYTPQDFSTLMYDLLLKYRGLSFYHERLSRNSDGDPVTHNAEGDSSFAMVGAGQTYQLGYTFVSKWEVAGRYASITPGEDILQEMGAAREYTLGVTKYIKGHRLKIQSDISYKVDRQPEPAPRPKDNYWLVRLQVEMGT